ncbi:flagellar basal body rod protein FlgB [bacterium]|nr:flagellar basal body rod protein FlgB [bacterium]
MTIDGFLFGSRTVNALERSLDAQLKRIETVTSNLANADTPGYKAREVDFRRVFEVELKRRNPENLATTHAEHMGSAGEMAGTKGANGIAIRDREGGALRVDGNTVDLDREMGDLAHAQLQYSAAITALSRKFAMLAQALSSPVD